ncbi:hypothetical protein NEDG_00767 [Nematocida displodere]|uniref:Uncharacterized protein n=1 Tax=Nematocida displodere TaxID=1805483 RepID=A0A177ECG1_9MICR|nr:hypothetical protein NEDG_00767 [Nematocida displodere]
MTYPLTFESRQPKVGELGFILKDQENTLRTESKIKLITTDKASLILIETHTPGISHPTSKLPQVQTPEIFLPGTSEIDKALSVSKTLHEMNLFENETEESLAFSLVRQTICNEVVSSNVGMPIETTRALAEKQTGQRLSDGNLLAIWTYAFHILRTNEVKVYNEIKDSLQVKNEQDLPEALLQNPKEAAKVISKYQEEAVALALTKLPLYTIQDSELYIRVLQHIDTATAQNTQRLARLLTRDLPQETYIDQSRRCVEYSQAFSKQKKLIAETTYCSIYLASKELGKTTTTGLRFISAEHPELVTTVYADHTVTIPEGESTEAGTIYLETMDDHITDLETNKSNMFVLKAIKTGFLYFGRYSIAQNCLEVFIELFSRGLYGKTQSFPTSSFLTILVWLAYLISKETFIDVVTLLTMKTRRANTKQRERALGQIRVSACIVAAAMLLSLLVVQVAEKQQTDAIHSLVKSLIFQTLVIMGAIRFKAMHKPYERPKQSLRQSLENKSGIYLIFFTVCAVALCSEWVKTRTILSTMGIDIWFKKMLSVESLKNMPKQLFGLGGTIATDTA